MRLRILFFALFFMLMQISSFAQAWTKLLPPKQSSELTLFDYQKAFNDYWAPFNVENGYYVNQKGDKVKAGGWKQFKRWEWFWEQRVNPMTGEFPDINTQDLIRNVYNPPQQLPNGLSAASWSSMGPTASTGGYAGVGRLNCINFHPSDNNTFWVGAASGGIWRTTNNGSSWTVLNNGTAVLAVSDIVVPSDYASSNTLYIATGDKDHWDNRSIGVLKSTDGGSTWNTTGLTYSVSQGKMVTRLLLDPANNQHIIAATIDGIYSTINGATNWTSLSNPNYIIDMEYKPGDFNTVYAGSRYDGKVYRSVDGGVNWTEVLNTSGSNGVRVELAVSPANSSIVYALISKDDNGLLGVYRSTDSGASFTLVYDGAVSGQNLLGWDQGTDTGGQGFYDLSLAVNPADANMVFVGGVNTWKSIDGGNTFNLNNHWYGGFGAQAVHADKHKLQYRSNGDLFECNDGGIYLSTNNGGSWTDKTNGMVISQMYKLGVSQTVNTEVITGLQDNGTKLVSAGTWTDVKGGDGMECLIDYTDVNIQYGTYVNGQIDRTTDHWANSTDISANISGDHEGAWVTPYIIDPADPATLYAGYPDVWKTTDRGDNWTKISTMNFADKIRAMAIAPSNNQVLYVSDPFTIWKTTNGGSSWSDISTGLPGSFITYISVKNDDPNTLWVTLSTYSGNSVYQSIDGGSSWTNISTGLPSVPVNCVIQNKLITTQVDLYAGTDNGVYYKAGAANWVPFNTGIPNVVVRELEIYYDLITPENSKMRAASYGRGLWETLIMEDIPVATCTDLFISEYLEGSSNNKYLEIYNPTCNEVNLTGNYSIKIYYNGSSTAATTIALTGTIASKGTFILAHTSAALAVTPNQTHGSCNFNGDDAIELVKGTTTLDVIGQIGFDPGSEWGSGVTSTADNTLVRKPSVTNGDIIGTDVFDPSVEWLGFAQNYIDSLGSHTITAGLCNSCCPVLATAPANVTINDSYCQSGCIVGGGIINAPTGTPCPSGSSLYYSVDNGNSWSTILPVYDQDGPAQTIITRCQCDTDITVFSPSSQSVTTVPGECIIPDPPQITIVNNVCPSTEGSISGTGCVSGNVLEWATNSSGPWSTTAPVYTTTAFTVYARCKDTNTDCTSAVVSKTTAPVSCGSNDPEITNSGGPTISDPCTCAGNGKFNEEVVVSSVTGETWTVVTNTNYLDPNTMTPFLAGTVLTENPAGSGQYTLVGVHMDDVGYSLSVTNGIDTLSITNECWYPDPTITGLNDNYCEDSPSVTLTGSAQLGDGSGPATAEAQSFTIDGNAATVFDPATLGAGVFEVVYSFNAVDDNPTDKHPGCTATDTLEVTVNALPDLTVSSNSPVCEGQTLSLSASGTGVDQWSWTGPNGFASTVQNPTIANVTTAAAGKYFVTGTNSLTGCSALDSTEVVINTNPTVSADSNSPVCEGENLDLTASGTGVDQWSWTGPNGFAATTQNPSINNVTLAATGKYFVTGLVASTGCSGIDSTEVVINEKPDAPIVSNINVCEGGSTLIEPQSTITGGGGNCHATVDMVITGVIDGPLSGGIPKAVEFYAVNDIPDLSLYGFGSANNGGGSDGQEYTFPADAVTAGTYIWVATESTAFNSYFGFAPTYTNANAPNINGDDAIELFFNSSVIDVFGEINVDGSGQPWEYTDGWVYRKNDTGQDGSTFVSTNWTYSGVDALDGTTTNASANNPFPIGTYICDLAIDPALFNFYSDPALTNLLAGPALSYDPGTTTTNSPQSVWVTQIDPNTGCESDGVEVVITIYAMPTAEAGNNQFYCGLPPSITISATSNYNGQWTENGAGSIVNPTSKTTTYTTNPADLGKTVVFTWTTNAPTGTCPNVTDSVGLTTVTITPDAEFAYNQDEYCPGSANPTVTHTTGVDGVYTYEVVNYGPSLVLDGETGEINIASSNKGIYAITNTVDGKGNLIITGVIDGPISGGLPKAIELYALRDISDLSHYGIESANNGNGSIGAPEFTFPNQSVSAGTFIWVASEAFQFENFFGLPPSFVNPVAAINGDDAIVLYNDGQAIDVFGDVNQSGTGQPWEYMDGWAYRKNNTGLDGTVFNINNWTFSGINALDGYNLNSDAPNPFPMGSFQTNLLQGCDNNTHTEEITVGDLYPPVLDCPENMGVVLDPGDCSAYLHWDDPVASDNCVSNLIIEQIGGPMEGTGEFTLNGSPYIIEYRTIANNDTVSCEFTVTLYGYPNPIVGQLVCNDTVLVSLDKECEVRLNADMFLEGGPYQCYNMFQLYINSPLYNGVNITNVPLSLTPGSYTLTIGDAANTLNTCNTVMILKDKYPPELVCNCPVGGNPQNGGYSADCTFDGCYDPNQNYNLPAPTVIEHCDYDLKLVATDIIDGPTCGTQLLRKTWSVTDIGGNTTECTQEYYFKGFDVANLTWPKNHDGLAINKNMIECDADYPVDHNGNPNPSYSGFPEGIGTCQLVEVFYNDEVYPLNCGTKILRNWVIVDDCTGLVHKHTQIIRITDKKAPTFCQPETFRVNTKAYSCDANVEVQAINCLEDNCCDDLKWWVGTSQNFQISGDLNGNGYVDIDEHWSLMNVPVGVYELRYYAEDCCGNVATRGVLFEVYDGIPPIASCEQFKTVSISVYGEAKDAAVDFNSGSFDNCKPVYYKALRVDNSFEYDGGCPDLNGDDNLNNNVPVFKNDVWYDDDVYYCCNDLGNEVMVGLRVFEVDPGAGPIDPRRYAFGGDLYGHFNDCWSIVTVECKIPPVLTCKPVTVSCEESLLPEDNPKLRIDVVALCDVETSYTDSRDTKVCGANITRTWTATGCGKTTTCKQAITVVGSTPFDPCTIQFPTDKQVHCVKDLPDGGKPTWTEYPCNVITAEYVDDTFHFVEGSCYKILREWHVIDWCVYHPNTGAEDNVDAVLSNRKFNCNELHVDGYYKYTQELRVVDFIPPTIHTEDQCIGFTDGCYAEGVKLHAFASDSCNTNEEYWWKYIVVDMDTWDTIQYSYNYYPNPKSGVKGWQSKDILDKIAIPTLEFVNPIGGGIYKVVWTVGDGCGNANTAEQIFTVVDKKAPTPILVNIATATMEDCMVEVCAITFDKGGCDGNCISSFDNCTPKTELYFTFGKVLPKLYVNPDAWENQYIKYGRYFYDPVTGLISNEEKYLFGEAYAWDPIRRTTCRVFGIDRNGLGPDLTQILEVYVWDKFAENELCDDNNYDFGVVVLSLNTEGDDCPQVGSLVGGNINNCVFDTPISDIIVNFDNGYESKIAITNSDGRFNSGLKEGSYNITAKKQISGIPGLTTLDLVIIQKHVLGIKTVNDYCKLASMDINGDGKITASDILSGRKLILGYTEPKLNYNFLSNSYISENLNNQLFSLKEAYSFKLNVQKSQTYDDIDFSGVLAGDVNNSAGNIEGRSGTHVKLIIDELELFSGESYEIPVYASGIKESEGIQFELSYNGFNVKNISSDVMDISKLNYKIDKNSLRFSWSENNAAVIDENVPLFTISIEAEEQSHLVNSLRISNETIKPEIYSEEEVSDLKLEFRNTVGTFALHQNIPNPFSDKAVIGFDLPEENTYILSIYDLTGKILKEISGYGISGYNSVNLDRKDIGGNGVFYYRLKSGDNTDTKKMILIQ